MNMNTKTQRFSFYLGKVHTVREKSFKIINEKIFCAYN